jgi:hypothetical protein
MAETVELTESGRTLAVALAARGSRVAAVALDGAGWPETFRRVAVETMNRESVDGARVLPSRDELDRG